MNQIKRLLLRILTVVLFYVVAYTILVDTREPSLSAEREPVYRSSFPWLGAPSIRWKGPLDLYFQETGPANRVFLPIDRLWRRIAGLPPAKIVDHASFWLVYLHNKAEYGRMKSVDR